MKFLDLAYMNFSIHIALIIVNILGIFGFALLPFGEWVDDVDTASNSNFTSSGLESDNSFAIFGELPRGLFYFIEVLGKAVFVFTWTALEFGLPTQIAIVLSAPFYMVYMVGIAQIITNRMLEGAK